MVALAILSVSVAYGPLLFPLVRWIFNLGRKTARWRRLRPEFLPRPTMPPEPLPLSPSPAELSRFRLVYWRPTVSSMPSSWYDTRGR